MIFVHGDGANWIKQVKNVFPECYLCLDKYHLNKCCKKITAGMSFLDCGQFQARIKHAFSHSRSELKAIIDEMIQTYPIQQKNILKCYDYLRNNFDAIRIYAISEEAHRGGATEPHVSHTLSARLSSRPMGWSAQTLKSLVPLLAVGKITLDPKEQAPILETPTAAPKADREAKPNISYKRGTSGLADPDKAVRFAYEGFETALSKLLRHIGDSDSHNY